MERLTYRLNDQFDNPTDSIILKPYLRYEDPETRKKILNRLAAYEDTGLEPQDIISAVDMAKIACALHELNAYKDIGPIDHLRDLLQAENEGRLVVLPSKTVWELTMDAGPDCDLKCPVDAYDEALGCDLCSKAKPFAYERPCTQERLKGLGKTVFLTREEAEATMKEANHA